MLFTATGAQMAPPHGCRQPSVSDSIWSLPGAYRIIITIIIITIIIIMIMMVMVMVIRVKHNLCEFGYAIVWQSLGKP
jgi:hypothetical protein